MRIEGVPFAGALVGAAVLLLSLLVPAFARVAAAQEDYADAGSFTYTTTALEAGTAGSLGGSLVVPDAPGPFPLIVASHGFSAASAQQLGWAQHFASYGFVVAVPSFPSTLSPNFTVDEGIIVQLVALYSNPATSSPAQGKVDPTRIGLEGHSAGGLATTLAAQAINPGAVVLFDPVDAADAGETAYAKVCSPMLDIFADPSACNNQEEWSTFDTDTTAPLVFFRVVGSTHCDGENMDRGAACGLVCGGTADPTRQAVYARYATAFLLAHLKGDATAAAMFTTSALTADTTISTPTVQPGPGCTTFGDGGSIVSGGDGGTSPGAPSSDDGGSGLPSPPSSGGSTDDGGGGAGTASGGGSGGGNGYSGGGTSGSTSGCGCSFVRAQPASSAIGLVMAALAIARRRRQRRA